MLTAEVLIPTARKEVMDRVGDQRHTNQDGRSEKRQPYFLFVHPCAHLARRVAASRAGALTTFQGTELDTECRSVYGIVCAEAEGTSSGRAGSCRWSDPSGSVGVVRQGERGEATDQAADGDELSDEGLEIRPSHLQGSSRGGASGGSR